MNSNYDCQKNFSNPPYWGLCIIMHSRYSRLQWTVMFNGPVPQSVVCSLWNFKAPSSIPALSDLAYALQSSLRKECFLSSAKVKQIEFSPVPLMLFGWLWPTQIFTFRNFNIDNNSRNIVSLYWRSFRLTLSWVWNIGWWLNLDYEAVPRWKMPLPTTLLFVNELDERKMKSFFLHKAGSFLRKSPIRNLLSEKRTWVDQSYENVRPYIFWRIGCRKSVRA